MDEDDRELVIRLFATATVLIETAHDTAIAGQSGEIAADDYAEAARRLHATARDVAILAEAVMIVANPDFNQQRIRPERPR